MSDSNGPKKETVRITLPPRIPRGSGGSGTSRISLPEQTPGTPPVSAIEPPRRVLPPPPPPSRRLPPPPPPARALASTAATPPPAPPIVFAPSAAAAPIAATPPPPMPPRPRVLPPPPRLIPPSAATETVAAPPAHYPGSGTQSGPRKETARITILPEPATPMVATVKMAKTQPLLTVPAAKPPTAPVLVAANGEAETSSSWLDMLDSVPLPVCWTIFTISTVTLLIQIWNYLAS